jgi:hypothetical protein
MADDSRGEGQGQDRVMMSRRPIEKLNGAAKAQVEVLPHAESSAKLPVQYKRVLLALSPQSSKSKRSAQCSDNAANQDRTGNETGLVTSPAQGCFVPKLSQWI